MQRVISVFNKKDEVLITEIKVDTIPFKELQKIFNPSIDDNLMCLVYPITSKEARELSKYIDSPFDFDNYIYQLDCFEETD